MLMFTGGTSLKDRALYVTVMQGRSMSKLPCDSDICDFIAVPSYPNGLFPVEIYCIPIYILIMYVYSVSVKC